MADVTNAGYYGKAGTLTIGADTHYGVTSAALVPTTNTEVIEDISGEVQAFVGTPMWRLQIEFNQDHATSGALSRTSISGAGTTVAVTYEPDADGDSFAIDAIMLPATVGGGTGRRVATLDLPCVGQPVITPAA